MDTQVAESRPSKRFRAVLPARVTLVAVLTLVGVGLGACSHSTSPPVGEAGHPVTEASCAFTLSFDNTRYAGTSPAITFDTGERMGTGTIPSCDDVNPGEGNTLPASQRGVTVYRVVGLDPGDGIAIRSGSGPNGYRLLGHTTDHALHLTPTFEAFVAAHRPNVGTPASTSTTTAPG